MKPLFAGRTVDEEIGTLNEYSVTKAVLFRVFGQDFIEGVLDDFRKSFPEGMKI